MRTGAQIQRHRAHADSMQFVQTTKQMRELVRGLKRGGKTIAFVPTMGALHRGHLKLIERAKDHADVVVVSIFVNPMQFEDPDDLRRYPQNIEADKESADSAGADIVFAPTAEEIYPPGFLTTVNVSYLTNKFEGEARKGHFRGVCTVVLKLLNIVQPDFMILGMKDAQQFTVLTHMVHDLALDVKVIGEPTVRDADGLALSSRNVHLNAEQRQQALCMHRALKRVHFLVKKQGILHTGELLQAVQSTLGGPGVKIEYAAIVNRTTLEPIDHVVRGGTYVLVAIKVGNVRLLDNTRI